MNKLLILLISCYLLVGCSTTEVHAPDAPFQESLLVKCTTDTPIPPGLTGKDVLDTLEQWNLIYNKCAIQHDALVDAIRERQAKNKG